jgi:hypothetical protein
VVIFALFTVAAVPLGSNYWLTLQTYWYISWAIQAGLMHFVAVVSA